ncbi:MAG: replicative DNA helicase [bacterium]|nr:replicative DNA helicase [bacterium]
MAARREPSPRFDRTPPQDLEAERSVLGAVLLNPDAIGTVIEILHENPGDVFYSESHQLIYGAAIALFGRSTPIDAVTLVDQLKRDSALEAAGGASYIAELTGAVPTSANVEYYARIVLDTAILRRLIAACTDVVGEAYQTPDDVNELLDRAESGIFSIAEKRQLNPIHKVADLLTDAVNRIETVIKSQAGYTGLPSGFHKLDEMLSGFQPSDMVILAARPSVGKTAFALNVASNLAIREDKSVLLFSLEMSKEQLVERLLCMEGRINSKRLRTGFLAKSEFPKLIPAADKLNRANIFIDDTPNISILDLRSKARRHAAQYGVDMIVIDYLQLMRGGGRVENRQTEIAEISRSVKGLARELRVPVLALSQLSREAEKDDTGTPKLSHLRESGAIEQDADVVMMLSRPPAHKRVGDDDESGAIDDNTITLTVAKQRNGPTGVTQLYFEKNIQRFLDPAQGAPEQEYAAPPAEYDGGYGGDDEFEPPDDDDTPF